MYSVSLAWLRTNVLRFEWDTSRLDFIGQNFGTVVPSINGLQEVNKYCKFSYQVSIRFSFEILILQIFCWDILRLIVRTYSVLPLLHSFLRLFFFLISEKYFALSHVHYFREIIKFMLVKNFRVLSLSQFCYNRDILLGKEKEHCQKYLSK